MLYWKTSVPNSDCCKFWVVCTNICVGSTFYVTFEQNSLKTTVTSVSWKDKINNVIVVTSYRYYMNWTYHAYHLTSNGSNENWEKCVWKTEGSYIWSLLVWTKRNWNAGCTWITSLNHTSNNLCWLPSFSFCGSNYGPGFLFSQLRLKMWKQYFDFK